MLRLIECLRGIEEDVPIAMTILAKAVAAMILAAPEENQEEFFLMFSDCVASIVAENKHQSKG